MRKSVALLLLSFAFLFSFTGCAPAPSRKAVKALSGVEPGGQSISFFFQAGRSTEKVWEELCQRFTTENPWGIQVIGENRGFHEDLGEVLASQGASGLFLSGFEGPTVSHQAVTDLFPLFVHPRWGMEEISLLAEDLESQYLVKDEGWRLPFLPLLRDMDLLYINLEEQEVPEDPQLVWELPGLVFPSDARTLCTLFFSLGGEARNREGGFLPGGEQWQSGRTLMTGAVTSGLAVPEREKYQGQMQFSAGEALISLDALSGLTYYERSIEAFGSDFSWTVAAFPLNPENGGVAVRDLGIHLLPGAPETVVASWLFYRWCMEPANQALLVEATGLLPLNVHAEEQLSAYIQEHPLYREAFDAYVASPRRLFPRNPEGAAFLAQLDEEMAELQLR